MSLPLARGCEHKRLDHSLDPRSQLGNVLGSLLIPRGPCLRQCVALSDARECLSSFPHLTTGPLCGHAVSGMHTHNLCPVKISPTKLCMGAEHAGPAQGWTVHTSHSVPPEIIPAALKSAIPNGPTSHPQPAPPAPSSACPG